jgi:hypothetical protein
VTKANELEIRSSCDERIYGLRSPVTDYIFPLRTSFANRRSNGQVDGRGQVKETLLALHSGGRRYHQLGLILTVIGSMRTTMVSLWSYYERAFRHSKSEINFNRNRSICLIVLDKSCDSILKELLTSDPTALSRVFFLVHVLQQLLDHLDLVLLSECFNYGFKSLAVHHILQVHSRETDPVIRHSILH